MSLLLLKTPHQRCKKRLESVREFDEIVVFDNGSEDETLTIASSFKNVSLHRGSFSGFGPTKNSAVKLARHNWVFSFDSDEIVTPELTEYLRQWNPNCDSIAGFVLRKNFFMGRHVKHGGWGNDWLLRIYNRTTHQFKDVPVHESVVKTKSSIIHKFPFPIEHFAYQDIGQFLIKLDRYTELRRKQSNKTFHPLIIFLRSLFAFFRSYILRAGFINGWRGLVIAWNDANGVFYKYMKRYADMANRSEKN